MAKQRKKNADPCKGEPFYLKDLSLLLTKAPFHHVCPRNLEKATSGCAREGI